MDNILSHKGDRPARSPFLWTLTFRLRAQAARRSSLTPYRCEGFSVQPAKPTWREQRQHQFAD